jgi:5-methylcytosine-specific restriction protein A
LRLVEVLGIENTERNMREVLEKAIDIALDRKDQKKKLERRTKREKSKERQESSPAENYSSSKKRSRYIQDRVREQILERASYRCEYIGSEGCRCTQRKGLEIDHRVPYARGGSNNESNLRVLCKRHNGFQAVRDFGEDFIGEKIIRRGSRVIEKASAMESSTATISAGSVLTGSLG